jgi:mono/diheme cytochrome c family protein
MKRSVTCVAVLTAIVAALSAETPARRSRGVPTPTFALRATVAKPSDSFQKYCFECHGATKPEAGLSLSKLVGQLSIATDADDWDKVAEMLENGMMPPVEAEAQPSDAERAAMAAWIRSTLRAYETAHAGDPGPVTIRRLTSAEYAYAVRDLTGVDIKPGIDTSSDSVGGEGFANFGDVQFVHDESIERYLEAAKLVADHAVIGSGPPSFYSDPGRTGLELSALNRINELYAAKGFRVVSGEGGRPFGLERYARAFYVAWHYKHRAALGDAAATIRDLAATEGISGRFAEHIWSVVNRTRAAYPTRETVARWQAITAPSSDAAASIAQARKSCEAIQRALTTWPSWFFARGDLAAGGAGDESPLAFNDETLRVETQHRFAYPIAVRGGRGRGGPSTAGKHQVHLLFNDVAPGASVKPVVVWRNAQIVTREPGTGRGAAGRGAAGAVLGTRPLRSVLGTDAGALTFGASPDGSPLGPDDFATTGDVSFSIDVAPGDHVIELQVDAELGRDRNAVVRLMLSDRPEGSSRDARQRAVLGDPQSLGYRTFRANMDEYVALLPPNSHGEANPADKDPVPPPFDNTYNSPEHDAFVLKVKYQRNDDFFTENVVDGADRRRLNEAWNDLFGSWPYHDAYLGMLLDHYRITLQSRRIADLTVARIAELPAAARPHLSKLRAHYHRVRSAMQLAEPGHVSDALTFASRAWRRPLSLAEKNSLRDFYRKSRAANGLDHDDAMRALLARILLSPAFLYRVEAASPGPERPLDGWELASRLSFFLWSSIPDDELRRAAAAGELSTTKGLTRQVQRMTADPKARRLGTEFFGQWLGFYQFDHYRGVDTSRFPEFTDEVKAAMYDEAVSTFEFIVRQQRPVKEIFDADYMFLNKPLAKFYGIDRDVAAEDAVERVEGAQTFNRGGALRLGAVLTTTSAPLRTSPVKRGDWVLRRVLGTPTPPPLADAGTLPGDEKAFNGLTLRERLAEHKRDARCASCHLRIDPMGFPLEGFDPVGRTRRTYSDGKPVDTIGELAGGRRIVGAEGLLEYLQSQDKQVLKTLSRKMIGYALGRTVLASDRPLIAEMVSAGSDATFAQLATRIVTSRQFRRRGGDIPTQMVGKQ